MVTNTFTWYPRWVIVVFILSRLFGIIAYFCARHKFKLTYGVGPEVRRKRFNRMLVSGSIGVASIAGAVLAGQLEQPEVPVLVCVVVGIVAFGTLIVLSGYLAVAKHDKGAYWITGCCPEFLDSIPLEAAQALERFKQKGARSCPSCGVLSMPPPGTLWGDKGYCSRSCLIQAEGKTAMTPLADSAYVTASVGNVIRVQCPTGHAFNVSSAFSGMSRPCPECGGKTRVP